ncbi:MAG: CoA transferase [Deltaproteobacteria bacterium]|nr:CoA transferase [Deltaproteobacteria bacterium]
MSLIIDMTGHSAAYAARLLAEAGHEVVRVESRTGDILRRLGPHPDGRLDLEHGPYHLFLNMGKKSLTLDVKSPAGQQIFLKLVGKADALVANDPFPLEEMLLREANSRLVLTLVEDAPPEICAYARSGLMSITGLPSQTPVIAGGHVIYAITGLYTAIATAAAMNAQQCAGEGRSVRVSVQQCLESLMEQAMVAYTSTGEITRRRGLRGQITAISGALACADGYWLVSVPPNPESWSRLKEWIGDPELSEDRSLDEDAGRNRKRDFVLNRIEVWSKRFSKEELVTGAQERHIAASPVATPADLVCDPQLLARGFLTEVEDPDSGRIMVPGGAISTPRGFRLAPAPALGQHNAEILTKLGYSKLDQQAFMESGVL